MVTKKAVVVAWERVGLVLSPGQFFANITMGEPYFSPAVILAKNRPGDEARVGCACSHVYQKTFRDSPHRPLLQMSQTRYRTQLPSQLVSSRDLLVCRSVSCEPQCLNQRTLHLVAVSQSTSKRLPLMNITVDIMLPCSSTIKVC